MAQYSLNILGMQHQHPRRIQRHSPGSEPGELRAKRFIETHGSSIFHQDCTQSFVDQKMSYYFQS